MKLGARCRITLLFQICFCLVASFGFGPIFPQSKPDDDTLRIDTNLVLLNVTVTDEQGRHVPGLKAGDFTIIEDGAPRNVEHFGTEDTPFAAAILIDSSGSMKTKIGRARVAAAHFQEMIRSDDMVAIYSFNSVVERVQEFSSDRDVSGLLWNVEARGATKLYDALNEGVSALAERPEKRRAIILISDGADTNSTAVTYSKVLKRALEEDVAVYGIDLVDTASMSHGAQDIQAAGVLQELSAKSGGRYVKSPGGRQLDEKFEEIVTELRQQYTLGFYPEAERAGGKYHKLEIKLRRPGVKWRTRQGYY